MTGDGNNSGSVEQMAVRPDDTSPEQPAHVRQLLEDARSQQPTAIDIAAQSTIHTPSVPRMEKIGGISLDPTEQATQPVPVVMPPLPKLSSMPGAEIGKPLSIPAKPQSGSNGSGSSTK